MFRKKKKKHKPLTFELKFKKVADDEATILSELWEEVTDFFVGRLQERTNLGQISSELTNDLLIQLGRPPLVTSDIEKKKLTDIFDAAFKVDQSSFDEVFASLGSAAKEAAPVSTPTPSTPTPVSTPTPPAPTPVSTPTPSTPTPVSTPTPPAPTPVSTPTPPAPTPVSTPTPPAPTPVSTPTPPAPSPVVPSAPPSPSKEEDRATGIALLRKEMLMELKELRTILDE